MIDEKTNLFEMHRKTLEGLAYRMLGSLAEAQDVVQETYLKLHKQDCSALENPRAWLIAVCTRLSLNQLKVAYKQRENYIGEWLPELFFDEHDDGLDTQLEIDETISIALLHVMEKLSPKERAVFILHDIFGMKFNEIAGIIDERSANCRQLATRARKHIQYNRPRFRANPDNHRKLLEGFIGAARSYDMDALVSILTAEVELYSDGGGKVEALPDVLRGDENVARFFHKVFTGYQQQGVTLSIVPQRFNGSFGLLMLEDGQLSTALTIECESDKICRIFAVRNPDKLDNYYGRVTLDA